MLALCVISCNSKQMIPETVSDEIRDEYQYLLEALGSQTEVWKSLQAQFGVLNQRAQSVFGIGALAISVTGFSGHRVVAAGPWSGMPLILGLVCILIALGITLYGVVRLHWMSQMRGKDLDEGLCKALAVRNRKTYFFLISLKFVVVGLFWYVVAVANYLYQAFMGTMVLL